MSDPRPDSANADGDGDGDAEADAEPAAQDDPAEATAVVEPPHPTTRRPGLPLLGAAAVVVVAAIAFIAIAGSDGDENSSLTDTFEGTGPLDGDDAELAWQVSGAFVRSDGAVQVPAGDDPATAVVEVGASDGELVVPVIRPADGAGVVFRFVDEDNHWRITYAADFATWNIDKVVDGTQAFVANTGLSGAASAELIVSLDADTISVAIDGERRALIADASHRDATAAGLHVADTAEANRERMLYEAFTFTATS